jgi:hypothetical protein
MFVNYGDEVTAFRILHDEEVYDMCMWSDSTVGAEVAQSV